MAIDAANHQRLFAPIKLARFAEPERQRHEGVRAERLAFRETPLPDEIGQACVAARVTLCLELGVQRLCRAPLALRSMGVCLQRFRQRVGERGELRRRLATLVFRLRAWRRSQPPLDRIARQTSQPGNLADRLLVAEVHTANLAHQGHGDHLCSPAAKSSRVG